MNTQYLYVAARDKTDFSIQFSFNPVGINMPDYTDKVAFVERQLPNVKKATSNK